MSPGNSHDIDCFLPVIFREICPKKLLEISCEIGHFCREYASESFANLAFFRDLPEPLCLAGVLVGRGKKPDVAGLSEAYEFPRLSKLTS